MNQNKCDCGGYLHAEEYDSQILYYRLQKSLEDQEAIKEFFEISGKTSKDVWFMLCSDCSDIRIRIKSKMDKALDNYRRTNSY